MNASTKKVGKSSIANAVEVEGASGGSYVRIEGNDTEGGCHLTVGHSCVTTVDMDIPVTWLAAVLTHAKDIGWENAMGEKWLFPADYALMRDPPTDKPDA
jgi:hypothetical protein